MTNPIKENLQCNSIKLDEPKKCETICPESNRRIFDTPLAVQRYKWVENYLISAGDIKSVTDFGCGDGRLMNWLKTVPHLTLINFLDIDYTTLETELNYRFSPGFSEMLFGRDNSTIPLDIKVYHGDLTKPDPRLAADCFVLVEVIEHMHLHDLRKAEVAIFGFYQPSTVIVTTPNCEFNHLLRKEGETSDKFRHYDHKFEWTRDEFKDWANEISKQYRYSVDFDGVGHLANSKPFGPCSQIAIFKRNEEHRDNNLIENNSEISETTLLTKFQIPGKTNSNQPSTEEKYNWTSSEQEDEEEENSFEDS